MAREHRGHLLYPAPDDPEVSYTGITTIITRKVEAAVALTEEKKARPKEKEWPRGKLAWAT